MHEVGELRDVSNIPGASITTEDNLQSKTGQELSLKR
jgi:hypothetical protein